MNPAPANTERILTEYVRALADDQDDASDRVPAVVAELRLMVRAGLRRSGRWHLSPSCLGYEGERWSQVFAENRMPDIVVDYCIHLFGSARLTYMINLVDRGGVVEPLCGGRLVNQFLYERHATTDECGYAVYQNTQRSVHTLVEQKALHPAYEPVIADTPVRFLDSTAEPATPLEVATVVRCDLETWEPVLRTLVRVTKTAQTQLANRLLALPNDNITALTISATADGLAQPTRESAPPTEEYTLGVLGDENETDILAELLGVGPEVNPNEIREYLLRRLEQLREAIPTYHGATSPTRNGMRRLVAELIRIVEAGEQFVQAEVARRFEVSRSTLNGHCMRFRDLARTVWGSECAPPPHDPNQATPPDHPSV